MKLLKWLSDELHEHRRYKLEMRRCANCDSLIEQLDAERFERSKLIDRLNKVEAVPVETPIDTSDLEPVNTIPSRIRRAQLIRDGFKRSRELQEEFERTKNAN